MQPGSLGQGMSPQMLEGDHVSSLSPMVAEQSACWALLGEAKGADVVSPPALLPILEKGEWVRGMHFDWASFLYPPPSFTATL